MKGMTIQTVVETDLDIQDSTIDIDYTNRIITIKKQSKTIIVPFENICKLEIIN